MKTIWKKIIGLFIGVAAASGIFMLQNGKEVDPNSVQIDPITFNGKQIDFTYTDDNTGENLILKTSTSTIAAFDAIYLAAKNVSPDDQNYKFQVLDEANAILGTVEEFKPQVPYEIIVPDYSTEKTCKLRKDPITNTDKQICDFEQIGTHKEIQYKDEWGTLVQAQPDDLKNADVKKAPDQFVAKGQFEYLIKSGETKYFRLVLNAIPTLGTPEIHEFYIKAFGSMGSFGNLDPWYNNAWGFRMAITLDYTKVATTTVITNFPILVSTTTPNLKFTGSGGNVGKSDGTDMLITASDGTTKLNHEIERYNSSTGETILWFNSGATALSTSTNTTYYLYYGNAAASNQQNINGTWDSNYKAVYHLPNGTVLTSTDSTSNGADLTNTNTVIPGTGQIDGDGVLTQVGTKNYLIRSSGTTMFDSTDYTIEAWFKPTSSVEALSTIASRGVDNSNPGQFNFYGLTNGVLKMDVPFVAGSVAVGATALSSGTWYHVATTKSGNNYIIYLNGVSDGISTNAAALTLTGPFYIGAYIFNSGGNVLGSDSDLDEVKFSDTPRSASWIKTEYNNQFSPGTFLIWGAQETAPITNTPPLIIFD